MPIVYGVQMRWSVRKDPCFVCEQVDHDKYMIEVERAVMLCPSCVEAFRQRCIDGKSTVSWGSVVNGARSAPLRR
jgi:hypothetical protein